MSWLANQWLNTMSITQFDFLQTGFSIFIPWVLAVISIVCAWQPPPHKFLQFRVHVGKVAKTSECHHPVACSFGLHSFIHSFIRLFIYLFIWYLFICIFISVYLDLVLAKLCARSIRQVMDWVFSCLSWPITCHTDRANEVNKMFLIWLCWFWERNEFVWRFDRAWGPYGYGYMFADMKLTNQSTQNQSAV